MTHPVTGPARAIRIALIAAALTAPACISPACFLKPTEAFDAERPPPSAQP